ncbi:CshA/CshB family fibrillar adhesin-related protein [Arcanobacterium phocae]|uniref:CshA/CshB family fibrillar adhesin-related protein n=1 Tax=Arcanobacterium phocae TaxID=131112 RepID=UPI001C0F24FA|nr:CshA/CshB family fibrillar adhesin-related protein [Arcanobacterium phocae]
MRRRKKIAVLSTITGLFLALFVVLPVTNTPANAQYGDGGKAEYSAPYVDMIDWVDWSQATDSNMLEATGTSPRQYGQLNWKKEDAGTIRSKSIKQKPYEVKSRTKIGSATVVTTCSLSDFYEDADTEFAQDNSWINVHIPGSHRGDGWDKVYHGFNENLRHGMPVGIGRAGGRIRFDVDCHAQLERINHQTSKEELVSIPIKGLVFADAETLEREEEITIIPAKNVSTQASSNTSWKVLGAHKPSGSDLRSYVSVGSVSQISTQGNLHQYSHLEDRLDKDNVLKLEGSYQALLSRDFRSFATMYVENATGAYIDFYAPFSSAYIAMGVVLGVDLADGPTSYRQAGAVVQPSIEGEPLAGLEKEISNLPVAGIRPGTAPFLGTAGPDADSRYIGDVNGQFETTWDQLIGDDETNPMSLPDSFNDEDAIEGPLLVTAQPGRVERDIDCKPGENGTTTVSGWLDWNADGRFDDRERANAQCKEDPISGGYQAKLVWDVVEDMLPVTQQPDSSPAGKANNPWPSLLRLIITTENIDAFSFGSLVRDGEVEDHAVTLVRPELNLTKQIVNSSGNVEPDLDVAGFTFTPSGNQVKAKAQTTTASEKMVNVPLVFNNRAETRPLDSTPSSTLQAMDAVAEPKVDVKVTESSSEDKAGYRLHSVADCTVPVKPDWVYQTADKQRQLYAWPADAAAQPKVNHDDQSFAFTSAIGPTTVMACNVNNQPYGTIKVTPQVNAKELAVTGLTPDSNLKFSGSYQCTPPADSPFSGKEVSGSWGPLGAGETWSSPEEDRIPLGSSCTIKQEHVYSGDDTSVDPAPPISNNKAYTWSENVNYKNSDTISAKSDKANEEVEVVTVENVVEKLKTANITWDNRDKTNKKLLGGATFQLVPSTQTDRSAPIFGGSTPEIGPIVDCRNSTCSGLDQDPRPGYFEIQDIQLGRYELIQTQPPVGYELAEPTDPFFLDTGHVNDGLGKGTIFNERIAASVLPHLPMSGGLGTVLFTLFGLGIGSAAFIIGYSAIRKKVRS